MVAKSAIWQKNLQFDCASPLLRITCLGTLPKEKGRAGRPPSFSTPFKICRIRHSKYTEYAIAIFLFKKIRRSSYPTLAIFTKNVNFASIWLPYPRLEEPSDPQNALRRPRMPPGASVCYFGPLHLACATWRASDSIHVFMLPSCCPILMRDGI